MSDERVKKSIESLVGKSYAEIALDGRQSRTNIFTQFLEKKKLPEKGFSDEIIEELLNYLSSLDSNNFPNTCGVGEREGRVYSKLVSRINFNFSHGIGRSGSLTESQPKAVGSTMLARLTECLLLDLIKLAGVPSAQKCLLVPMATGMTLVLIFLSLRQLRPKAKFILWSRIDQKSCFKAISTAGFTPVIIDTVQAEDELKTDVDEFENLIQEIGAENIACIYSTTSCFAPRACDDLLALSKLARDFDIPHVVNNAYGLQSTFLTHQIEQATKKGRIDVFVSSADKNLMVPVSGCIVAGFNEELKIERIADTYAGRATSASALNVFITLLSMGREDFLRLVKERKENFAYLKEKLTNLAEKYNEKVLLTKNNPISVAFTLENFENETSIGSMLFKRGVSGARVVPKRDAKEICGFKFEGWGSHTSNFNQSYLTAAVGIGAKREEIDTFITKLDKVLAKETRN
ncbi:O-phosphoseryl-tRNA(Sec) selenium transferase isoform X2 [Culicoides brevitarsis]|uniref:O-phosphoseryl-tRNA(Sec) selenium transferase isoform X2 n=1 Tax=Culicoides brevitarsis TaxID=469753 RepID=UPI00307C1462